MYGSDPRDRNCGCGVALLPVHDCDTGEQFGNDAPADVTHAVANSLSPKLAPIDQAAVLRDIAARLKASRVNGNARSHSQPTHYKSTKGPDIQPWDVVEGFELGFHLGNVIKYVLRAGKKGPALPDLHKAAHYIQRAIEIEEQGK